GGGGCGGAETFNWASPLPFVKNKSKQEQTLEDMEGFAMEGLRTLLVAVADISWEVYSRWEVLFDAASTDMVEIEKRKEGGFNAIDALMDEVEVGMHLLGCTAIEDKLQKGVGGCISDLQNAGIGVWMLTGDKEETAVNIGVACQLLRPEAEMERVVINMDPRTGYRNVKEIWERLEEEHLRLEDDIVAAREQGRAPRDRALVIDGQSLILATHPSCRAELATFAMECKAVVCCRVSPDQKREVVAMVRENNSNARTLAIGDGANDVAMIQGAHIGVGISGQEGMQVVGVLVFVGTCLLVLCLWFGVSVLLKRQWGKYQHNCCGSFVEGTPSVSFDKMCSFSLLNILKSTTSCVYYIRVLLAVNSSDFAIAQFSYLRKLALVHGRRNYRRTAKLVCYTFYKNILMAVPMAWYAMMNGFSGQKFYTEGGIQLFNVLFTLWPVLALAIFDYDVSTEDGERYPRLYVLGIYDVFFNARVFWSWIVQATVEALLITMVPILLFQGGKDNFGTEISLFEYGAISFTLVVFLSNSKILWLQYRWTWVNLMLIWVSIGSWFCVAILISTLVRVDFDFFQASIWSSLPPLTVFLHLLRNPSFYAVVVLCFTAVFIRDITWKFYHRWWRPKLHHIVLEAEASGRSTPLLDLSAADENARVNMESVLKADKLDEIREGVRMVGSGSVGAGGSDGGGGSVRLESPKLPPQSIKAAGSPSRWSPGDFSKAVIRDMVGQGGAA
ncbi:unnamed protein product, partial [Choristocarpus tenellus]